MELHATGLCKEYRRGVVALRDFTLRAGPGVIGLLGPNGAGKSTLMRILATVARPTSGSVLWNGTDIGKHPDALRRELGYLPQDFGVYPNLNAVEFLRYLAAAKGLSGRHARRRVDELLEFVNLTDAAHRPIGGYSGGMRQRVGIAQALLNDPRLLIVDEPTVGLDPTERARFRDLVSHLAGERIVILSTHIVSDVESVATSIALVAGGRLLRHASPVDLVQEYSGRVWSTVVPNGDTAELERAGLVVRMVRRPEGTECRVVSDQPPDRSAHREEPTLEDAYLALVRDEQPAGPGSAERI
ncbi:MAG: ABC transporter ATP-binding protein [Spirochaetaceae bacterium]|nr:MAG: ABC transporter ATP-binding protein [Spirochaetaceae bacterium]